jgi:hypothetical protein
MLLTPRAAFEGFGQYLSRFTAASDADVEDQFFDRKDVSRPPTCAQLSELVELMGRCWAILNELGPSVIRSTSPRPAQRAGIGWLGEVERAGSLHRWGAR